MLDLFNLHKNDTTSNCSGQESKKRFAVYESDTAVTLKQGQDYQTWYELVG